MGVLSNKIERETLKPGDHIYSWRSAWIYAHHGVYTGEGRVIHFTRAAGQEVGTGTWLDHIILSSTTKPSGRLCEQCGDQSMASGVISSCLDCFLSGGDLYLFEYGVSPVFFVAKARGGTCTLALCDSPDHVLHRALYLLENGFGGYNIFSKNCEDFAVYCKTGFLVSNDVNLGGSGQTMSAVLAAVSTIGSSPLRFLTTNVGGMAAVGCGMYCVSRYLADVGIRPDVIKVPVETLVNPSAVLVSTTTTNHVLAGTTLNGPSASDGLGITANKSE